MRNTKMIFAQFLFTFLKLSSNTDNPVKNIRTTALRYNKGQSG